MAELLLLRELVEGLRRGRGGCLVVERRAASDAPLEVPADLRTLHVHAAPEEQLLAYAALTELCQPLLPLLEALPPIQARALEGALALGPPSGDALAVAAGFRSLLHVAAEREPLLVVVDDAHQVDRGTAAVVAYAARRLDTAALGIAIAQDPHHPGA
ncbi:MAG: helix-turn-helix transcriptional regulator, partial [Acidimicrobiales bacterium]